MLQMDYKQTAFYYPAQLRDIPAIFHRIEFAWHVLLMLHFSSNEKIVHNSNNSSDHPIGRNHECGKKEKVRLIGVDTPEKDGPYTKAEPFNREASAFTKMMVKGNSVRLEYDWQKRDKYGRLLAYVYLEDSTFLNAELVKQGYATVFRKFRFKYRDNFIRYEQEAKKNKKGLWK